MLIHELNAPIESLCDIFQLNCQLVDESHEKVSQLKSVMEDIETEFSVILKKSCSNSNSSIRSAFEEQKVEEEPCAIEQIEDKNSRQN
jgi:hypothetical protein